VLPDPFILRRVPGHIRSDNGPEFVATSVRARIAAGGATTARVAPGSPGENGCVEPFNARRRHPLLDGRPADLSRRHSRLLTPGMRHRQMTGNAAVAPSLSATLTDFPPGRHRDVDATMDSMMA
jgi:hypothetical protein